MKKQQTNGALIATCSILLALALLVGGFVLGWFAKQNKWFEKDPAPTETEQELPGDAE